MKILHIVADHSAASGGVFQMIESMGLVMRERGHEVQVLCTGEPVANEGKLPCVAHARNFPFSLYASKGFRKSLEGEVKKADLVHVHSNWTLPVWRGCEMSARLKKGLIHSPHGTLSPMSLQHHALRKRLVSPLDRKALKKTDRILASGSREAEWIRKWMPSLRDKTVVIPPGILPMESSVDPDERTKQIVFAGRLHPMKGIELLLRAWAAVKLQNPELALDWSLVLAGEPSGKYRGQLDSVVSQLNIRGSVQFMGLLEQEACQELFQRSALVVLPSHSENFGMVVAEAMACATPVITTTATPWDGIVNRKSEQAGWVVDPTLQEMSQALVTAVGISDSERRMMGNRGKKIIEHEFSRKIFGDRLEKVYEEQISVKRTSNIQHGTSNIEVKR